ncbi:MAG: lipase [Cytophagaceae bacterium BCCC1]|nr:MAG: lipase [Cytophagaceae bacterium BCCC1]
MKTLKKILKFTGLFLILLILVMIGYIYSLTFTPYGRMHWQQAAFAKLTSFNEISEEQFTKMTLEDFRNMIPEMSLETVKSVDTLKITKDSLNLFIYKPAGLTNNAPIVIYYHGGGWYQPFNNLSNSLARQYANRFTAIIVAVDYRTAPKYPFPTHINDSYNTFKWVVENAQRIGGNPDKIAVIGESAGGNIATVICQKAKNDGFTNIKYQVLFCPSTDIGHPLSYPSMKKFEKGYLLGKSEMNLVYKFITKTNENGLNPDLSPMLAHSLSGLPPAFVITAEFDPLHDEGLAYARRLNKEGVPTKFKDLKGCIHVMAGPFMEEKSNELNNEIAFELEKVFK